MIACGHPSDAHRKADGGESLITPPFMTCTRRRSRSTFTSTREAGMSLTSSRNAPPTTGPAKRARETPGDRRRHPGEQPRRPGEIQVRRGSLQTCRAGRGAQTRCRPCPRQPPSAARAPSDQSGRCRDRGCRDGGRQSVPHRSVAGGSATPDPPHPSDAHVHGMGGSVGIEHANRKEGGHIRGGPLKISGERGRSSAATSGSTDWPGSG